MSEFVYPPLQPMRDCATIPLTAEQRAQLEILERQLLAALHGVRKTLDKPPIILPKK